VDVVNREVLTVDLQLNQMGQQIVGGLAASIGDHHVDVCVQFVQRFRARQSPAQRQNSSRSSRGTRSNSQTIDTGER
jgi:hypothetical protein